MTNTTTKSFQKAIEYLEKGYSVMPIKSDKRPVLSSWKHLQTESADLEQLEKWFEKEQNIGIITGKISGITIIDIDVKEVDKITPLETFPETFTVQTPSGGWHLYYKYTDKVGQTQKGYDQYPNVDIRNDGGYALAPPSTIKGSPYKVINKKAIQPFPEDMFVDLKNKASKKASLTETEGFDKMKDGSGRNNELARITGLLVARHPKPEWGIIPDIIKSFNKKFKEPLEESEVVTTYESIIKTANNKRIPSPYKQDDQIAMKLRGPKTNPHKDLTNILIIFRHHEKTKDKIKYNSFKQEIEFEGKAFEDAQILELTEFVQRYFLAGVTKDNIYSAVQRYAFENEYDEAKEWIKQLKWDGEDRLLKWIPRVTGGTDDLYHQSVGAQWMLGMVKRIMFPGCTFDHVLVAIGGQGVGKTSMFRIIGGPWYKSFTGTVENKDFYLGLRGAILMDLDEGVALYKSDSIKMKSIITQTIDEYRAPYDRTPKKFPRRFVFSMSTNDIEPFRDTTGNRRYLPIELNEVIDFKWLEDNRDQLFAEAYDVIKNERLGDIDDIPQKEAEDYQEKYLPQDSWTEAVVKYITDMPGYKEGDSDFCITIYDIFKNVIAREEDKVSLMRLNKREEMRIGNILRNTLHMERKRMLKDGERKYHYFLSPKFVKQSKETEDDF